MLLCQSEQLPIIAIIATDPTSIITIIPAAAAFIAELKLVGVGADFLFPIWMRA